MKADKENHNLNTFHQEEAFWGSAGSRPQLMFQHEVYPPIFASSVHLLMKWKQIMHVCAYSPRQEADNTRFKDIPWRDWKKYAMSN